MRMRVLCFKSSSSLKSTATKIESNNLYENPQKQCYCLFLQKIPLPEKILRMLCGRDGMLTRVRVRGLLEPYPLRRWQGREIRRETEVRSRRHGLKRAPRGRHRAVSLRQELLKWDDAGTYVILASRYEECLPCMISKPYIKFTPQSLLTNTHYNYYI